VDWIISCPWNISGCMGLQSLPPEIGHQAIDESQRASCWPVQVDSLSGWNSYVAQIASFEVVAACSSTKIADDDRCTSESDQTLRLQLLFLGLYTASNW
jgi:hypothetical protein